MHKWALIMNPKSGKKTFNAQKKYVLNNLNNKEINYEYRITEYSGHAVELAREFTRKGYRKFIVLGGDGTISELVNGIFQSGISDYSEIKIAIIPSGTGNDWARFWKLTRDYKKSLNVFFEGKSRYIDIGKVTLADNDTIKKHYFINSIGFGLDAEVVHLTHRLKKILGSFSFLYTIALLLAVFRHKPTKISIKSDENTFEKEIFTMNIANGCYSGGGIKQTPEALPYDGIFDVMVAKQPTFKDVMTILPRLFNGTILQHRIISSFKGNRIDLEANEHLQIEADGIIVSGQSPISVEIIPAAIQMIIP